MAGLYGVAERLFFSNVAPPPAVTAKDSNSKALAVRAAIFATQPTFCEFFHANGRSPRLANHGQTPCTPTPGDATSGLRASLSSLSISSERLLVLSPASQSRKGFCGTVRASAEEGSVLALPDLSPLVPGDSPSTSPALPSTTGSVHHQHGDTTPQKWFLKDMSFEELEDFVVTELQDESRRAHVLWWWLYRHGRWAKDPSEMEGVSRRFREKLAECAEFDSLILDGVRTGRDGTRKLTFRLKGGDDGGVVEAVLIPMGPQRNTVCVSSQLGCAMGCEFCFTAKMGLRKQLSVGQIVDQLVQTRRLFSHEVGRITNVVFMGMGEPLHNLDNVLKAVSTMVDLQGLQLAAPRITVSTSGLVPEIRRFCRESPASLAVSLNATTDEVRSALMPVNRRYPLAALLGALREEFPRTKHQERVFLEYIMLAGVNDSLEDAYRLLELTADIPCKINLIVFNPHEGTQFGPSPMAHVLAFRDILIEGGRMVFIRQSRGDDEMAACGQLGQPGANRRMAQAL